MFFIEWLDEGIVKGEYLEVIKKEFCKFENYATTTSDRKK